MAKVLDPSELAEAIRGMIEEYSDEAIAEAEDALDNYIEEDLIPELQKLSPALSGKYSKGWAVKKETSVSGTVRSVYNKKKPGLTHLLENGHADRGGGFVAARPHMRPAFDATIDRLEERIKKKIGG